ncbi:AAA family ATPase [uncultured Veillonella sp.]|uniref:McrB family protein n=1 Tax=uncultured Veillonella sp. TaxID=159268 RepID=UPI003207E637
MSNCWIVSASFDIWKEEFKGEFNSWEDWKEPISYNFYSSEGKNRRRFTKDINVGDLALIYAKEEGFIGEGRFIEIIPDDKLVIKPVDIWPRVVSLTEIKNNTKLNEVYTEGNHFCASFSKCSGEAYKEALELKNSSIKNYDVKPYVQKLESSKNIILRGAPGTGKTYLSKQIAASIITDNKVIDFKNLTAEQKRQVEFVQFHPSYDYTDFVEGLRLSLGIDGKMEFVLKDGIFKSFIEKARVDYENHFNKSKNILEKQALIQNIIDEFLSNSLTSMKCFKTKTGNSFNIIKFDEKYIVISIPSNDIVNMLQLSLKKIKDLLMSGRTFETVKDIMEFLGGKQYSQKDSYYYSIYKELVSEMSIVEKDYKKVEVKKGKLKKYVFIIDEINRGEISKIFGELFFSLEPGYRGETGAVSTQYSNLYDEADEKFYIPENVYIIGTMNDIDRSVDSFDFAMRRRFRFIEITPNDRENMLDSLSPETKKDALNRMNALNKVIAETEGLNENYQIGPSYFLHLKNIDVDDLWTDYLQPLLHDYIRGMYNESSLMDSFKVAYFGNDDESAEN